MSSSIIRNSASRILAAALSECLPGMEILEAGEAFGGVFCDFAFSQPITSEILPQLEERIRQIVREKREIRVLEMVPFSASEYLKKKGQERRAKDVLGQEGFVHLVQIGSFVDWSEGFHLRHTGEMGLLRLMEKKVLKRGVYRIFGFPARDKKELKGLIGRWEAFPERDHERAGAEQGFWEIVEGERIWLPRGLEVRRRFCAFLRKIFQEIALEIDGGSLESHKVFAEKQGRGCLMQFVRVEEDLASERGLLDEGGALELQVKSFVDFEKDCTSFLQTIHKSLTILGFTYRVRYCGRKRKGSVLRRVLSLLQWVVDEEMRGEEPLLEFLVEDALGSEWVVAALSESAQTPRIAMGVRVERNLALLLEKSDALLPFWIAPEHLRILPVDQVHWESVEREQLFFKKEGFRVGAVGLIGTLTERIRQAQREKVPFVAIIGDKELESGALSLRRSDGMQDQMSREQLLKLLREVDRFENK